MKKKVPKFLITQNKLSKAGDAVYLVHIQHPSFVAQVKFFKDPENTEYAALFEVDEVIPVTRYCYVVIEQYLTQNIAETPNQKAYLRKRLARWVEENYLKLVNL